MAPTTVIRRTISPWIGFGFVMAGTVLSMVVQSLPNASLAQIESDIGLSPTASELSWTLAFATLSAFLVPAGQLSDRIGRMRAFLIGSFALAAFCLLGGLAWGGSSFLLFRALQGAAIAMIVAPATGIVNVLFPDARRRGMAFAIFGLAFGLGMGLGPVVGAVFLDTLNWRWGFFFSSVALILAAVAVRVTMHPDPGDPEQQIDLTGGVLLVIGLSLFFVAIDQGRTWGWLETSTAPVFAGWTWPFEISLTSLMLIVSLGCLVALALVERHRYQNGEDPLIDPAFFRIPSFSLALVAACLLFFAMLPLFVIFPLVSQVLLGQAPLAMSLTVAPIGLGIAFGSLLSAPLGRRWGSKWVVVWGLTACAIATLAMIPVIRPDIRPGGLALGLLLLGLAIGVVYARVTELILSDVQPEDSAHASGLMFSARAAAGAIGSVVLMAIITVTVAHSTPLLSQEAAPADSAEATALAHRVAAAHPAVVSSGVAGKAISDLTTQSPVNPVIEAQKPYYVDGFRLAMGLAALSFGAGAVVTMTVPNRRREAPVTTERSDAPR
jgi:MFS family permease